MRIAGIDPGTRRVGYALLESERGTARLIRAETIIIPQRPTAPERLRLLEGALAQRLKRDRPDAVAIERLFFAKNSKTAMAVAEARGVILLTAQRQVNNIWEYTPLEVKMAVSGYGRADKSHIRRAVRAILPRASLPDSDDAMDAVAIALAAVHIKKFLSQ